MSFRLVALTPTIGAAPGESVVGRIEIHNDGTSDAIYTVAVVGLAADPLTEGATPPPLLVPVPAGSSVVSDVVVVVPRTLGIGQHAAAFEATSSRSSDRAALVPFTVSIQSVSRVELVPLPSTIRARRKGAFHLDVTNNELLPVEIELTGEAPDVDVSFVPRAVSLQPGQRTVAKGRVKGPRHWSGEPTQHTILITARGRAAATSVKAAYVQRPLFAHRLRMVVAAITVVALWLTAIGGALLWLERRNNGTDASAAVITGIDTDGDGIPDAFFDADGNPVTATDTNGDGIPDKFVDADGNLITGTDTDGDGIPDTLVDAGGNPIEAIDTDGDGIPDTLSIDAPRPDTDQPTTAPEPKATTVRGTVEIDGDPTRVVITTTAIELGAAPSPNAAPIGLRAAQPTEPQGKIWSARTATLNDLIGSSTRRTVAIAPGPTAPGPDGVWVVTDVLQGQSYEVSFSSPGYDTQSFVLTPRADGQPIDLDVEMKPSQGALSGTVVDPSGGPLGGAEIQITDGTLDFSTTSASGNGTWSLQGVSTPGVYTITSTLRGFATAVRQVELRPGDTPTGITLQMAPGLGTITGRVTTDGTALGGVTVTASSGDTTLTTTTLTEGLVGFYQLPQLAIPATYTVKAELDGYVTNSRPVELEDSQPGVDFLMTSTTTTLTGRVLSSAGGGIESAGLIISTGDLQFRASTSPVGVFEIDRLPPGDYTVTAEHFEHESVTEFTTLDPSDPPAPLEITLPLSSGPTDVGTGSLVVSVINDDPTIDPPGINNAEVTIKRIRTNETRKLRDPNSSAVTFDDLPIGTYTISVRADGYNLSAPITKTVGQTRERAEVQLQRLGQASGSMINSLDPSRTPLRGYSVTLYRLAGPTDPIGDEIGTYFDTDGEWTTPDTELPTGLYRIEATSPLGFLVRNDQVIDTSAAVGGRAMTFLVPELTNAEVKPLEIPPIEADPYPTITGRIYQPRLNGVAVGYDALDDASLRVTGVCDGTRINRDGIKITDSFGNSNPPANDLLDTFSVSKEAIAAAVPVDALPGTCEFTVTASGRITATIEFTDVVPSDGVTSSNRLAAAALVRTPEPLGGTVFWFDTGRDPDERIPLDDVAIAAAKPVITGFTSSEASATTPDPRPIAELGPLSTTSDPTTGAWTLDGQVFGTSSYVFTADDFAPGIVPVTINETARVIPAVATNANVFTDPDVDGSGFGIELTPPDPGTVSGNVTIQTTSTPKYVTDMVKATDPTSTLRVATPNAATGDYTFDNAIAGTWSIDFDPLPNHVREPVGTTPEPIVEQLLPGRGLIGLDATYTELATVQVRLFDKTSEEPITLPAGLDLEAPTTPILNGDVVDRDIADPDDDNVYELTGIPVAANEPTTTTVAYRMALLLDDYDLLRARIDVNGTTIPATNARDIALPMVAGRVTEIDLYIDTYKQITGSIAGRLTEGGTENLSLAGADPEPLIPAELDIERGVINETDGTFSPLDPDDPLIKDDPTPTLVPGPDGTFSITGAPGYYRLTPSHPQYQDTVASRPPNPSETLPDLVYELGSDDDTELTSAFELTLRESTLSVNAVATLASNLQVEGAVFDYALGTTPCTSFPSSPIREDIANGGTTVSVAPGTYCVAINKFGSDPTTGLPTTTPIAFPAIVEVTVPRTSVATPGVATVVAPLPALRPTLIGKLVAENVVGDEVELVVVECDAQGNPEPCGPPVLTSEFTQNVSVRVSGTTIPNENPNSTGVRSATAVPPDPLVVDSTWTYTFVDIPYGENKITAPYIEGYLPETPAVQTFFVGNPDADPSNPTFGPLDGPEFVYTLDSAPVEIALGPGVFPSLDPAFSSTDERADVFLVSKSGTGAGIPRNYTFDASTNTLIFFPLPPEKGDWTLSFDDALHEPFFDDEVKIGKKLNDAGRFEGKLKKKLKGDLVRLTGLATQRFGSQAANVAALDGDALMTLTGSAGTYQLSPGTPPYPDGTNYSGQTYVFDVIPGTYTLTTSRTDYFDKALLDLALPDAGTMLDNQNVEIVKKSVITVSVATRNLALPPDLRVDLLETVSNSVYGPVSLELTGTTGTATFEVPAGTYRARTVSASYPQRTSSPDSVVGIGATPTLSIVLQRIARFNVSGPTTATVTIGGVGKSAPAGTPIEFTDTNTTGTLSATVSADDYRTKVVTVPAEMFTTTPVILLPDVTVRGTIAGASNGTIQAINDDDATDTKSGTITAGSYEIPGLDVNDDGTDKSWTISYTEVGVGTGSTSLTVSGTSATPVTGQNITLVPRNVDYNFTVTSSGAPVPGATITISPAPATPPPATDADGLSTAAVAENVAFTWTVKKSGYLTRYGSLPTATSLADVAVPVSMVAGVSGVVDDGTDPVDGATVEVCASGSAGPCSPAGDRTFTTNATGEFTITSDLLPGTYTVWAFTTGADPKQGSGTLTITDSGSATVSDITIS